jgi:hypothetical protein
MKTVIIRIGDIMAAQKRQNCFVQTNSGVVSAGPKMKGALNESHGHEEWRQRTEADWQTQLETLQQCVCELLLKNQQLRMALVAANEPERGYRDAVSL